MKQTYTYEVNGFQIHAEYEEKDIETIFIPLLKKWKEMQKKAGRRILVFLSAPPGTGKTTAGTVSGISVRAGSRYGADTGHRSGWISLSSAVYPDA